MHLPTPADATILDDGDLLRDRLLRSLHRNRDGHLAVNPRRHVDQVEPHHNIAVLYVYRDAGEGAHSMAEQYVFSHDARPYADWRRLVIAECHAIHARDRAVLGVYGWLTSTMKITPLRTGDLFIKIDKTGAHGVRIAFNSQKTQRAANAKTRA